VSALREVGGNSGTTSQMWADLAVVGGVAVAALVLAAGTLRRRTA